MRPTLQRFGIEEKLCGGMGFQITSLLLLFLCLPRVRLPKSDDDDGVYSREARIIFPFICSRWESIIDFVGHHHTKTRRQSIYVDWTFPIEQVSVCLPSAGELKLLVSIINDERRHSHLLQYNSITFEWNGTEWKVFQLKSQWGHCQMFGSFVTSRWPFSTFRYGEVSVNCSVSGTLLAKHKIAKRDKISRNVIYRHGKPIFTRHKNGYCAQAVGIWSSVKRKAWMIERWLLLWWRFN